MVLSISAILAFPVTKTFSPFFQWALIVEPRNFFGIFLGSAGGVRDIQIPSLHECSIESVQKGVEKLLKDPINKPLCVYVRAPVRG